ncbi:MAG: ParB/RepB/Spo0J family partition protein [Legionellales bacterium]|nr:ParB/RepB/Spo0J family partition protein [Legionellales bacterium]
MNMKRRGLGRNLDALLGSSLEITTPTSAETSGEEYRLIPIERIQRSPFQPRREFDQQALEELAQSIRAQGLIQPIILRRLITGDYELVAGERRWRASQLAGLNEIPALIRDLPDNAVMAMALIENIQRENLNPIEEAQAISRLIHELDMTHQQAADALGKSRTAITNLLRLLNLHADVRILLERGDIEMGHARALLALENREQLSTARHIVEKSLSVRETEKLIRRLLEGITNTAAEKNNMNIDPDIKALENKLSEKLGAKIEIKFDRSGKGNLIISYNSLAELDGILAHIH